MSPEGSFAQLLRQACSAIVELSDSQIALLQAQYELLLRWNKKLNLTRIEGLADAVERHYAESLFLGAHLPAGAQRIADIGSGAGFPGFPVAVLRPGCEVALIESHQRKAVFLREASRGLKNVRVIPRRAEEIEERFDLVISRAVSYGDLFPMIERLGGSAYLLTGSEEPPVEEKAVIPLPWGRQRFLRVFHVKH